MLHKERFDLSLNTDDFLAHLSGFEQKYPAYRETARLDDLRAREYARLDRLGHVYLDYTGGGLYAESQVREHANLLANGVFGNPHSNNPTSLGMTRLVERARAAVFEFFNASPAEYVVIFTPNASGALKLVGESYPFDAGGRYTLTYDNHNSVNGIREFARGRGAVVTYVPVEKPEMRVDQAALVRELDRAQPGQANLFAFPAQSNFSGVQHPLEWIDLARSRGWDVLVDCAAFAPTNRLDIDRWRPDFVPLSFYKIFGYPTGIGCLIARRSALARLRRPWFAGGTITIASVQGEGWHYLGAGEAAYEDGTVNYLGLPAVEAGLSHIAAVGMETIHRRVDSLAAWLLTELSELRHSNGAPLLEIFGPTEMDRRGGTLALKFIDPEGQAMDFAKIEALAATVNISLRTGCFCNPGAGEIAHGVTREEMAHCFAGLEPVSFDQFFATVQQLGGKSPSTVRVSLGLASNFADVYRFRQFAQEFVDRSAADVKQMDVAQLGHRYPRDSA
ncbi:MAG: aminotransferase class V-fold PLP-dependent enzyme [Caldilineaceae bacterium]|nr:aminotransferase class V-fold PLP-dependent enzyme [Caldilineaceae bacterium]